MEPISAYIPFFTSVTHAGQCILTRSNTAESMVIWLKVVGKLKTDIFIIITTHHSFINITHACLHEQRAHLVLPEKWQHASFFSGLCKALLQTLKNPYQFTEITTTLGTAGSDGSGTSGNAWILTRRAIDRSNRLLPWTWSSLPCIIVSILPWNHHIILHLHQALS